MSTWSFLTRYWWLYRAAQGLNQYASDDCRPELIWFGLWGSALWSDETKFQFLSLSLIIIHGRFVLQVNVQTRQLPELSKSTVCNSAGQSKVQNWKFHPCDAECYKLVKGQRWFTVLEAKDMFHFISHVKNKLCKLCTTIKCYTFSNNWCESIEHYQFNVVISTWWASFSELNLHLAQRTRVIKCIFKDKPAHCCPYLLEMSQQQEKIAWLREFTIVTLDANLSPRSKASVKDVVDLILELVIWSQIFSIAKVPKYSPTYILHTSCILIYSTHYSKKVWNIKADKCKTLGFKFFDRLESDLLESKFSDRFWLIWALMSPIKAWILKVSSCKMERK